MTKAVRIHRTGGPEVLCFEDVDVAKPGPGEVVLRQTAVGVNFIDVYHRTGLYPAPLPTALGLEGAGTVEAVGEGVQDLREGDRVAYANPPIGAYAERRVIPAHRLVKLPDTISDSQAAGMILKGMTAQYLLRRTYRVQPGDTILIHAAAGGVGLLVCQWAKHLGATVIGTVGSEGKAALAKAHGCDHAILYKEQDLVGRVRELTAGKGVTVVYDSVGRDTFDKSLDCLRPLGMMVSFGQSSGKIESFDTGLLAAKGSLFLTRPTLMTYTANRDDMLAMAGELFDVVGSGKVKVEVSKTYPLSQADQAHRDLESRVTTGSLVLLP